MMLEFMGCIRAKLRDHRFLRSSVLAFFGSCVLQFLRSSVLAFFGSCYVQHYHDAYMGHSAQMGSIGAQRAEIIGSCILLFLCSSVLAFFVSCVLRFLRSSILVTTSTTMAHT